ncbi:MAG: TolC family protein [Aureisphaera sp.]
MLSYEEFIGYVKAHHPLMKQADLRLTEGEATLLRARGGFDPKIEVDYDRKQFKGTEYWDQLNATFKIPTWYGFEFKANFEQNSGDFLNREFFVPEDGLYSAGVSLDIARGFLINDRMASLRKAKFFMEQTKAERDLILNDLIFEATKSYLDWLEAYNEELIFSNFLSNAQQRFQGVKQSVEAGDKAAIDSTEARITLETRLLNLEAAKLKRLKAALKASNFLWLNEVPLEIQEGVFPNAPTVEIVRASLTLDGITDTSVLMENHPKLRSLDAKIDGLRVDRSLKRNKLLPKVNLEYNFLTPDVNELSGLNTADYKGGITFQMPLFLRKERGDARLANLKLKDANLDRMNTSLKLQNTIAATNQEISSLEKQQNLIVSIVSDYEKLVRAEERKFELGESSLFLINAREQKLIESRLKKNSLEIKSLKATVGLYNALGLTL